MNLKKLIKLNYQQLIFVFAAFSMMVLVSYWSVSGVLRGQLVKNAEKEITNAEANNKSTIMESQVTLINTSITVRSMIDSGGTTRDILDFFAILTKRLVQADDLMSGFNGIYGVVWGEFIDGTLWEPPANYIPEERPWYMAAINVPEGEVGYTQPYVDAQTGKVIISASSALYDSAGEIIGVLAVDVDITLFAEYVRDLEVAEGGYGILLDRDFNIIAHPDQALILTNMRDIDSRHADIADRLQAGGVISGEKMDDPEGVSAIVFYRLLFSDCYVGVITPAGSYYRDLVVIASTLSALGLVLMLILCYSLLKLSRDKLRSEEENRSKTSFLARMSHEIRTPMNAIIGMAELALREDIPIAAYEHILAIKQSSANLLSIINDILDFSKIESGKLEIASEEYLFSSLVNDVINIIRMRVADSHLRFVANIDSGVPNALIGDEIRIRQIILNLLSNAAKYTEEGFVSLTVSCEITGENTVILTIEVADSGRGIKKEDMDRLFGDYVQIDLTKNKGIEGTGLGLAITRNFIKAMSGSIAVRSEYGKGSVFTVTLPQTFRRYEKLATVDDAASKSVLVYERREIYAKSIIQTIENLGVRCMVATTESEFYENMIDGNWTFVFVSSYLLQNAKNVKARLGSNSKVVLLTELTDSVAEQSLRILTMPIHPISVANILNGISDRYSYSKSKKASTRFVAPTANILIVDDVNTNLKVAEGLMLPYKMRIDLRKNGGEAIAAVRTNSYDLVLMDHMMPEMDGVEATKRIRALDEGCCKIVPIIALTANAISGAREMFLQNGFDDFLSKPIDTVKLNAILEKWIPKEKQKKYDEEGDDTAPGGIEIPGLDTAKGIAMTGGSPDNYLRTLAVFHRDGIQKIDEIRSSLETNDLSLYVLCVHSLKSALGSLGAGALSEEAKALETAGNQKDLTYISENNERFILELQTLLKSIGEAVPAPDREAQAISVNMDALRGELSRLRQALEVLDSAVIDGAMESLQGFTASEAFGPVVESILQNALIGEYDEAVSLIERLLTDLSSAGRADG